MKMLFLLVLLSTFFSNSFAQKQTDTASHFYTEKMQFEYMQRSRLQKVGAYFLLATGLTAGVIGGIDYATAGLGKVTVGPVLLAIGGASFLGSTFLFVKAAKNKKRSKALAFHLQIEDLPISFHPGFPQRRNVNATARINF